PPRVLARRRPRRRRHHRRRRRDARHGRGHRSVLVVVQHPQRDQARDRRPALRLGALLPRVRGQGRGSRSRSRARRGGAMDAPNARVALRERGLLDVLDLAVRFMVAHASIYVRLTLAVVVPLGALVTWAVSSLDVAPAWLALIVTAHFVQLPYTALAGRLVF